MNLKFIKLILKGTILKPNMVISGSDCKENLVLKKLPRKTLDCLKKNVPTEVPGIAFLSGGQSRNRS